MPLDKPEGLDGTFANLQVNSAAMTHKTRGHLEHLQ
jgi:hypothetical protein